MLSLLDENLENLENSKNIKQQSKKIAKKSNHLSHASLNFESNEPFGMHFTETIEKAEVFLISFSKIYLFNFLVY